ncbi:hypothetical protein HUT03_03830 [Candidatus Liberibacter africanus]|nr:hypothetical protein HUT03_03830 [Candidatus Liberibacter africanus]
MCKILSVQHCLKSVAEVNLTCTILERKKINILREELINSINSTALTNPLLASHYSRFYHYLSDNDKKISSLQSTQEHILLSEKAKIDRLTEMTDRIHILEERQFEDKNNEENIEQKIIFNAVSRKFMSL